MAKRWDNLFKGLSAWRFRRLGAPLETEGEVRHLALTIDAIARCQPRHLQRLVVEMPFYFFTRHNLMEFKSPGDPLTLSEFHRIMARAHLYAAEHEVKRLHDILVCIICVTRPRWLLEGKPSIAPFTREKAGIYRGQTVVPCWVIVTRELTVERINYPLLVFTTGQKRKESLRALIADREYELLTFAYMLYPQDVEEEYAMAGRRDELSELRKNFRRFAEYIGVEKMLATFPPEERLAGLKPEERLAGLKPEERLAGLKPEELEQLQEAINRLISNGKVNGGKKRRKK